MTPIRLFILAVLFYLLYRLLTSGSKANKNLDEAPQDSMNNIDDILVEDPVCHTYIPKSKAEKLMEGEREHYFCSKECLDKYQETERS